MSQNDKKLPVVLSCIKSMLKSGGIPEYALEAELILAYVLSSSRIDVLVDTHKELSGEELSKTLELAEKRLSGFPIQYILGVREFMGLSFHVSPSVLIPRVDTEILVETALSYIKRENAENILEIGTGSGCIAVSLAKFSKANIYALDISGEALSVAGLNAEKNEVSVNFLQSDLFSSLPCGFTAFFDAVVSNPPYIPTGEIPFLMKEVSFEPVSALDGGADGLDFYRKIASGSKRFLKPGGALILETGHLQGEALVGILKAEGFSKTEIINDMEGRGRVVFAIYNS